MGQDTYSYFPKTIGFTDNFQGWLVSPGKYMYIVKMCILGLKPQDLYCDISITSNMLFISRFSSELQSANSYIKKKVKNLQL